MALVRCEKCGRPQGTKRKYVQPVLPVGYPNTAAVCGRPGCDKPGLVWLDQNEWQAYQKGQRVFEIPNRAMKVKVEPNKKIKLDC